MEADGKSLPSFSGAAATHEQPGYPASASIDDNDKSGWAVGGHDGQVCEITWTLSQPLAWPSELPMKLILEQNHGSEHLLRGFELSFAFSEAAPSTTANADNTPETLANLREELATKAFDKWLQSTREQTGRWQLLKPKSVSANMARLEPQDDGSFLGDRRYFQTRRVSLPTGSGTRPRRPS